MEQKPLFVLAHEWLCTHPQETQPYAGQWVAVFGERIIAASSSLKAVLSNPDVRKHQGDALVARIPTPQDVFFVPANVAVPVS